MTDRRSLEDVRYYLRAWRSWCLSWRPRFGVRSCLDMLEGPPAWDSDEDEQAEATERDAEIGEYILHRVDQCVDALPKRKRVCVRHVYLREACDVPVKDARRICQEAELDLVPMLRARNVVIGTAVY